MTVKIMCSICKGRMQDSESLITENGDTTHSLCYFRANFANLWLMLRNQLSHEDRKLVRDNAKIIPFPTRR